MISSWFSAHKPTSQRTWKSPNSSLESQVSSLQKHSSLTIAPNLANYRDVQRLLARCSALITASAFVRLENIFWHLRTRSFKPTKTNQEKAPHRMWKFFPENTKPTPRTSHWFYDTFPIHSLPPNTPRIKKTEKLRIPWYLDSVLEKVIGSIGIVSKKYRYAGFSCQSTRQLTDLIIVVTKNPAENPAKTLTESITNQSNGVPPCSPHTRKVYKSIEVRLRLFFAELINLIWSTFGRTSGFCRVKKFYVSYLKELQVF